MKVHKIWLDDIFRPVLKMCCAVISSHDLSDLLSGCKVKCGQDPTVGQETPTEGLETISYIKFKTDCST